MSDYTTIANDTFETIARKVYGTEVNSYLIIGANPGVFEPLAVGLSIVAPPDPSAPKNAPQFTQSDNPNEVSLFISGKRYRFFTDVSVEQSIDKFSTFSFSAPFEPSDPNFRESFRPFGFDGVELNVGGDPWFTGSMVSVDPVVSAKSRTVTVKGYSRPGVLGDCTAPDSISPLEFNGQGLQEIANTVATPFWLSVEFRDDQGDIFEQVAAAPSTTALTFLANLARQRGLIISNTELGALLFWKSIDVSKVKPVATLRQGESPLLSVAPAFTPQSYYSHITGVEPSFLGLGEGEKYTVKNTLIKGALRTLTFNVGDVQSGSLEQAVKAKMGRMFANMVAYTVGLSTWRDPAGKLWKPNTAIIVNAPGAMIYEDYTFIIRNVRFVRQGNKETAELDLMLPGGFSGELAGSLPWE